MEWLLEYTVPSGEPVEEAYVTPDKVYYLQRSAPDQKKLLYVFDKINQKISVAANGLPVSSLVATETQVLVLLEGVVSPNTPPLPDQVGEIFQLEDDDSIKFDPRAKGWSNYLKAGTGIKSSDTRVVACKADNIDPQYNVRLLVWLHDRTVVAPQAPQGGNLGINWNSNELPAYRWTVTSKMVFAINTDGRTIIGAVIPEKTDQDMSWSITLEPTPVDLDAVFCTDDGRLFVRSTTGQILQYRRNAWEWTFSGQPVAHDRSCCAAGGIHFVRSDDQNCYALCQDGQWQVIGEKITAPRINVDMEGVTVVTGIRNGREIVSQELDYLPLTPSTVDGHLVRRNGSGEKKPSPNWLLTFKTANKYTARFSGRVEGRLFNRDSKDKPPLPFEFTGEFKHGMRHYVTAFLDIDYKDVSFLRLETDRGWSSWYTTDHWTLDWVEAWHLPSGRLLHFKIDGDVPDVNDWSTTWPDFKPDLLNWNARQHVSGQSKAQLLFWDEYVHTKADGTQVPRLGHAALRIVEDGTYISFWPVNPTNKVSGDGPSKKHTPAEDLDPEKGEGKEPDATIEVIGLDLAAIVKWWKAFDVKDNPFNPRLRNCATIVWQAFVVGGVLQTDKNILRNTGLTHTYRTRGYFWPADMLAITEELYKIGYYPLIR